jgi:flagellar basal body rod protein FlgF
MINQAIRGSIECYLNVDKEVSRLDHVAEVNEDISNFDDSINLNLWALNEEMGFDIKIKEKISVAEKKLENSNLINPKHFITLPDVDRDIELEKNVVRSINHIPETVESKREKWFTITNLCGCQQRTLRPAKKLEIPPA